VHLHLCNALQWVDMDGTRICITLSLPNVCASLSCSVMKSTLMIPLTVNILLMFLVVASESAAPEFRPTQIGPRICYFDLSRLIFLILKVIFSGLEIREYGRRDPSTLTTWHPITATVGTTRIQATEFFVFVFV
jgi:hypothetical protein